MGRSEMPPKFVFIRHGEAEHNVAYHKDGVDVFTDEKYRDAPLTEKGVEQARKTAEELSKYNIVDIWSSPLTRCIQTSLEVLEETSASKIYIHDSLIERQGGKHYCNERKAKHEIDKEHPYLETSLMPDLAAFYVDRETLTSVRHRMLSLLYLIAEIYKDIPFENTHIAIVTHKDAIFALLGKEVSNAEFVVAGMDEIKYK